ncbi:MAG: winged helix-turn-helix transcriptional regulator [Actinomycetota bacterium]
MSTRDEDPVCEHFQRAAEIIGRRWNPQLVRVLLTGPARYRDLKAAIPAISDHLLSRRLKELEAEGIIRRRVDGGGPVRVEYALTDAGEGLAEAIAALGEWAERFARRAPAGA